MVFKKSNEQSMREAIQDLLETYRLTQGIDKVKLKDRWEEMMGPAMAKRARIHSLHKGRLVIKVESAALRQELDMVKTKIAERLNAELGREVVQVVVVI